MADRIDHEDADVNKFTLTVKVCDAGSPALCDTVDADIKVTNRNEAPVVDDAARSIPETTLRSVKLSEGDDVGVRIIGSDPDGPLAEENLEWSIVGGNGNGYF